MIFSAVINTIFISFPIVLSTFSVATYVDTGSIYEACLQLSIHCGICFAVAWAINRFVLESNLLSELAGVLLFTTSVTFVPTVLFKFFSLVFKYYNWTDITKNYIALANTGIVCFTFCHCLLKNWLDNRGLKGYPDASVLILFPLVATWALCWYCEFMSPYDEYHGSPAQAFFWVLVILTVVCAFFIMIQVDDITGSSRKHKEEKRGEDGNKETDTTDQATKSEG